MTMDMVAARAKAGKAAVYRRWVSKTDLVRDALAWMGQTHLELKPLPDTGNLRNDLLALLKPLSIEEQEHKLKVIAGLGSFSMQHQGVADAENGIFAQWMVANRALMQRAVDRGELHGNADVDRACRVILSMASYRGLIERKPIDRSFFVTLIDSIVLPALKNPGSSPRVR